MKSSRRVLGLLSVHLAILGCVVRLAPLTSHARTIAAISEDGYLMLTVARNLAMGRSLTIADGTIPTNGIQPLVTFLWAGVHWIAGGQRAAALRGVILIEFAVALVTAALIALLIHHALRQHPLRTAGAMTAAALWFASPVALQHTTNGLETGVNACVIAAVLLFDLRWRGRSALRAAVFGSLLGVLFLVRNDAVFLVLALVIADVWRLDVRPVRVRLVHAVIVGTAALVIASPWLAYNARHFGSVVPISGRAQNLNATIGENIMAVPRVLAEYTWMVTPLPVSFAARGSLALVTALAFVSVVAVTIGQWRRVGITVERWMVVLLADAALLAVYYGLFFGAAYFLSRYLFPLSLVSVLVPLGWILPRTRTPDVDHTWSIWRPRVMAAVTALLVTIAAVRFYQRAAIQDHMQVVQWVTNNVPAEMWVGAPQSGTLGYFHDRTINLDGKVNPLALNARRDDRLFHYIVDDTPIEYIADWYGLARWVDRPDTVREERDVRLLSERFCVLIRDGRHNLVVLKRKSG